MASALSNVLIYTSLIMLSGILRLQAAVDGFVGQNVSSPGRTRQGNPVHGDPTNGCPHTACFCDSLKKEAWCSSLGLRAIPTDLPGDMEYLHLEHNSIEDLDQAVLGRFPNLVSLNVSHNLVSTISPRAFSSNPRLYQVDLQANILGGDSGLVFLCSMLNPVVHLNLASNGIHQGNLYLLTLCNVDSLVALDMSHNNISGLPQGFLAVFPKLQILNLDGNSLTELPEGLSDNTHPLESLGLAHNQLGAVNCSALQQLGKLQQLHLAYNLLYHLPTGMCSEYLPMLRSLDISGNWFSVLGQGVFAGLTQLTNLQLSHSEHLLYLAEDDLVGLPHLALLDLSHSTQLEFIHADALVSLGSLTELNLNNCNLSWLHEEVFRNLTNLLEVHLSGNPWHCDCDLKWLISWLPQHTATGPPSVICSSPDRLLGSDLLNASVSSSLECQEPLIVNVNVTYWFRLGSQAVLDCETTQSPRSQITWITPSHQVLEYHPAYPDLSGPESLASIYHWGHSWHDNHNYLHQPPHHDKVTVLKNGSLFLDYITRPDAGNYTCMVENGYGNHSAVIVVRMDSSIMQWVKLYSMLVGLVSALSFFVITVSISSIRYLAIKCSTAEKLKKKSIREVLGSLHDFKTVQIDRFCAYKTAKINKLSAYKTDKMHKLVAFKTAKVGKLLTYKQVTMASIFHHMEKMKEHYNSQMNRVKDNCSQQVEKIRDNYSNQAGKFKDYRHEKIERIRENYNMQVLKVRDYRSAQMDKLRDQYKLQQQHLFKLMELLDIGNCLNVVEAECMRTESMLFDPNISFDLEAQPVHVHRDLDFSDDSEYLTAGSLSEQSNGESPVPQRGDSPRVEPSSSQDSNKLHMAPHKRKRKKDKGSQCKSNLHHKTKAGFRGHRQQASDSSSSLSDQLPTCRRYPVSLEPPPPPNFSCGIADLNNRPLEDIVANPTQLYGLELDFDSLSLYQTPPTSESEHMDINVAKPDPTRPADLDSVSMEYESVGNSRSHSPQPSGLDVRRLEPANSTLLVGPISPPTQAQTASNQMQSDSVYTVV